MVNWFLSFVSACWAGSLECIYFSQPGALQGTRDMYSISEKKINVNENSYYIIVFLLKCRVFSYTFILVDSQLKPKKSEHFEVYLIHIHENNNVSTM